VTVSVSVGIAVAEPPETTCDELLRKADLAMYLAKQNGKGRFEVVRPGMVDGAVKRLVLITDLRHAVDDGQFEVFYQPLVGVRDEMPTGAEALVRWHHPQGGLVTPDNFVGAAESTGLIVQIGDWVLNQACRQAQAWHQDRTTDDAFYVSVNVSPRRLAEPDIIGNVAQALHRSGLRPDALVLEITETSLILDFQTGLARLQAFKDLGVRIALDDFGTGYSCLNRLQTLPADIVKIDKSFIDQVTATAQDRALVKSIIDVTHAVGMISVAEGVEDREQYCALAELGCDAIQGYLFARPHPSYLPHERYSDWPPMHAAQAPALGRPTIQRHRSLRVDRRMVAGAPLPENDRPCCHRRSHEVLFLCTWARRRTFVVFAAEVVVVDTTFLGAPTGA
jgi:EAL domain-containing protein (putative c-di-GMP-specific phosphodiesterase class I)